MNDTVRPPCCNWRNWVGHWCALIVAAVFLYAAIEKIVEPRQFALQINNYQILPEAYVNLGAIFLPWIEAFAAVALIGAPGRGRTIPPLRAGGAILITGMLVMFIAAVSYAALYKGLNINCGCFGKGSAAAGWSTIGLDVGLLFATLGAVFLRGHPPVLTDRAS